MVNYLCSGFLFSFYFYGILSLHFLSLCAVCLFLFLFPISSSEYDIQPMILLHVLCFFCHFQPLVQLQNFCVLAEWRRFPQFIVCVAVVPWQSITVLYWTGLAEHCAICIETDCYPLQSLWIDVLVAFWVADGKWWLYIASIYGSMLL